MARIAYVDHSYHQKTRSTEFLPELLSRQGHEVHRFWDEEWTGGVPVPWKQVAEYDVVIMFQTYCSIVEKRYSHIHPNVVFIPMLDQLGIWNGPLFDLTRFWAPFRGSKVLSFTNSVHGMAVAAGVVSFQCKYFPELPHASTEEIAGLHGFFWLRREDQISWRTIRRLIADTKFDSFHIHIAPDPGSPEPEHPSEADKKRFKITISTWFEDRAELDSILARTNVFFCSRMEEGIGQAFIDALARGKCVVAPNHGSMNEYILHGLNGLLYEVTNPEALDFTDVTTLGQRAKVAAAKGREWWSQNEGRLIDFVMTPSAGLYVAKYQDQGCAGPLLGRMRSVVRHVVATTPWLRAVSKRVRALGRRRAFQNGD